MRWDYPSGVLLFVGLALGGGAAQGQQMEIGIEELQAPQAVRPDSKFPLRVEVVASKGLHNEKCKVMLEARRTRDSMRNALPPNVSLFEPKEGTFQGKEIPRFDVDYQIDLIRVFAQREKDLVKELLETDQYDYETDLRPRELDFMRLALKKNGVDVDKIQPERIKNAFMERFLEGEWEFTVRVKKHPRETSKDEYHVSQPARVLVMDRKPRILLFAGAPTREYQFLRTLLAREAQARRLELSVYLQSGAEDGVDQDVPPERLLKRFPYLRGLGDPKDRFASINNYDLIIAVDANWTALDFNLPGQPADPAKKITNADQARLVKFWVEHEAGGIIFVAGHIHTHRLAMADANLADLPKLVPVVLKSVLLFKDAAKPHPHLDLKRPYALHFAKGVDQDLLKVDPTRDIPSGGWGEFFWGAAGRPAAKDQEPKRGFFYYYPVEKKQQGATVLATFAGPKETFINDGAEEHPFLVTMPYGQGKTVFVGNSEIWRLRQYRESYYEAFWLNMIRYTTNGIMQRTTFGRIVAARSASTGVIPIEVQLREAVAVAGPTTDGARQLVPGNYLPRDNKQKPRIYVRRQGDDKNLAEFSLEPKSSNGPWLGWFEGKVTIGEPGDYVLVVPILAPGQANPLTMETMMRPLRVYQR